MQIVTFLNKSITLAKP